MELRVAEPAPGGGPSPLASARLRRQLTVEEAARRTGLTSEQVEWLEGGRVYRFPSGDDALATAVLYASALGIEPREARELAGLPVPATPVANTHGRLAVLAGLVVVAAALAAALLLPRGEPRSAAARRAAAVEARLPPPWKIEVDVLNGAGDIDHTRSVASRVGALAYRLHRVARADRFDYRRTAVYFEPRGQALGVRLARQLGVVALPLPAGANPRRLVVIVGPRKGPGD
jgi:transcriptional regulator with XRE-family HTH domain